MDSTLFLTLMVLLAAANLWLGKRASAQTKTEDDFYLSGRSLGLLPLVLTILATQLGGGTMLGAAEEAYQKGWAVLFYPLGTCLGLCLVSLGFGARVRKMNLTTISELYEKVYRSAFLRKASSLISIISLFIILVAQGIAARKFFAAVGFDESWIFISFWMILITYTVMGGLRAVVNTDILQVLFIGGAFALAFFVASFGAANLTPVEAPVFDQSDVPWIGWLLMPLLFMFIEQDMAQRFFSAKTPGSVTKGALMAAFLMLVITAIPLYFGIRANELGVAVPEGASILLVAIEAMTTPAITTVVTVAILMAIISTADTLLCSISSNISYDFKIFANKSVLWAQGITFTIGVISLIAGYAFNNVVSVLIFSYELSVSALFATVIIAVFGSKPNRVAAVGSVVAGTLAFLILRSYPLTIPREILTQVASFGTYYLIAATSKSWSLETAHVERGAVK